jgi:IclR family pca regulon transcriptional regulator
MERLVESVKESCSAAVLDGADIVYVLRVPTHKIMSINLGIGSRLPAYCTSMGRMLLAEMDPSALDALLREQPMVRRTARTITDPAALKRELAIARQQGWCIVDQELEEGLVSLSAPIRDRSGQAIAAMNISGQVNRTPPAYMVEHFLPKLRAAAGEISLLLQRKS